MVTRRIALQIVGEMSEELDVVYLESLKVRKILAEYFFSTYVGLGEVTTRASRKRIMLCTSKFWTAYGSTFRFAPNLTENGF
jgi:hypothetical protein